MVYIDISDIKIPYNDFLIRAGYKKTAAAPDKNAEILITETLETARRLIKPKTAVIFSNIKIKDDTIVFDDGFKINSSFVTKLFKECFKAYAVAVTIGKDLEKKRDELIIKKETLRAFFLDAAGSVAAEEIIKTVYSQIGVFEEKQNNLITKRFSPGYGDWQASSQKLFLERIGAEKIGISLTSTYLMIPEKSVSAIIGVKKKKTSNI